MPGFMFHGMSRVGKIENRESMQQEITVVDGGVSAYIDNYFVRLELQFGCGSSQVVIVPS